MLDVLISSIILLQKKLNLSNKYLEYLEKHCGNG